MTLSGQKDSLYNLLFDLGYIGYYTMVDFEDLSYADKLEKLEELRKIVDSIKYDGEFFVADRQINTDIFFNLSSEFSPPRGVNFARKP